MYIDKIIDELVTDYMKDTPYATKDDIVRVLEDTKAVLEKNKDKTPEEIIDIFIEDCIKDLNRIMDEYTVPGIISQLKVDNINISMYGGLDKPNGNPLTKDALFDVASISKLYTQIIAYKLINEGVFDLDEEINKLDPRFENVSTITVEDVLKFKVRFQTEELIEDTKTKHSAKKNLFGMQITGLGMYNYNDMCMMLMKEVMENLTGKSFEELFYEYIIKPYNLNNTYLTVPKDKKHLITGTPNIDGSVNDLKANAMGGYSGHAGVRVTSDDLIKLSSAINNEYLLKKGLYSPNKLSSIRSEKMGNLYVNDGDERSYFGYMAPSKSIAAQGSTRVITRASKYKDKDINSTILTNMASITDEQMIEMIQKKNRELIMKKEPMLQIENLIKERKYNSKTYKMHDIRILMPEDETIGNYLYKYDNELNLKLLLLK